MPDPAARGGADYAYCEMLLRRDDPDRWLASLFAPAAERPYIHALCAFSLEIARVREIVSEPLLGEIRFQWWRDALEAPDRADVAANPVAAALLDTAARFDLPKQALLELIDARLFDLYDDSMETVEQLEAYARATSSNLFRLVALILDQNEPVEGLGAAEHGGTAYALTGLLRALPWHCARGQAYVPLALLRKHGAERADLAAGLCSPGLLAALADLRGLARHHLDLFGGRLPGLPDAARVGYLALSLCEPYLRLMDRRFYDPFKTVIELPKWRRQWTLWRASKNWG